MSISSVVSVRHQAPRATRSGLSRAALATVAALGSLLGSTPTAGAQSTTPDARTWELRVASGAFVPTGNLRTSLKSGQVTAAQLSWVLRPSFAITGTFGWARSRDLSSIDAPKLDIFTADLGVEVRAGQGLTDRAVTFTPFVGLGAGARSYDSRDQAVDAVHNLAGYGAVGGEFGIHRIGLRLEARVYGTGFKPLIVAGKADLHNDVVIMAALRFNRKRPAQNQ